jgi:hypothetical protein
MNNDNSNISRSFIPRRYRRERCLCCGNPQHEGDCPTSHENVTTRPPLPGQIWKEGRSYDEENAYLWSVNAQWGFW